CSDNELTDLDISKNNDLESINATKNKLKSLDWLADLPAKDKLKSLNLFGNEIGEVDFAELITNFPNLEKINLSGNPLKAKNLDNLSSEQFAKLIKDIKDKKIMELISQGNQQQQNAQYLQTLIQGGSPAKTDDGKRSGNNVPLLIGGLVIFGVLAVGVGKMDDLLTELKKTQPTIYFELEGEKEDNEEIKRYSDYIRRKVNERKNIAGEDIYCSNCGKEE
ncbi:31845_t:CDS:2, partial [Gigaspora margarita]